MRPVVAATYRRGCWPNFPLTPGKGWAVPALGAMASHAVPAKRMVFEIGILPWTVVRNHDVRSLGGPSGAGAGGCHTPVGVCGFFFLNLRIRCAYFAPRGPAVTSGVLAFQSCSAVFVSGHRFGEVANGETGDMLGRGIFAHNVMDDPHWPAVRIAGPAMGHAKVVWTFAYPLIIPRITSWRSWPGP